MAKRPKQFRRICMVSSAVFNAASGVYGWMALLGAALGLAVDLTEYNKSNIDEFNSAVDDALELTRKTSSSNTKRKILDELYEMEVEPDTLGELIKKTDAYRTQYCKEAEVKEINNVFESFFRDEISKRPQLSNLFILSTGFATLEKLKSINDILIKDEEKLDNIQNEVVETNKVLAEIKNSFLECVNSISFILVAMAVFLGINIFTGYAYDRMMIEIAPICYGISEFFVFFLKKNGFITLSHSMTDRWGIRGRIEEIYRKINNVYLKIITEFVIPISITVACFWIILLSIRIDKEILLFATFSLICGNVVSIWLKNTKSDRMKYEG